MAWFKRTASRKASGPTPVPSKRKRPATPTDSNGNDASDAPRKKAKTAPEKTPKRTPKRTPTGPRTKESITTTPVSAAAKAKLQEAQEAYTKSFPQGSTIIPQTGTGNRCGLFALRDSIRYQAPPKLKAPTVAALEHFVDQAREAFVNQGVDAALLPDEAHRADQLAAALHDWGLTQGVALQLGIKIRGRDPYIYPVDAGPDPHIIWIMNKGGNGRVRGGTSVDSIGHYEGLRPTPKPAGPGESATPVKKRKKVAASAGPSSKRVRTSPPEDLESARRTVWLAELESIRRKRPLLKGRPVTTVTIADAKATAPVPDKSGRGGEKASITLLGSDMDNDDDDNTQHSSPTVGSSPAQDGPDFYVSGGTREEKKKLAFYQNSRQSVGQYPSPTAGLRFHVDHLLAYLQVRLPNEDEIRAAYVKQRFGLEAPRTLETALKTYWLADERDRDALIKGFPMVENVVFYVPGNLMGAMSNCFFKAVAYHVYGNHDFYVRAKAEHLEFFNEVLKWKKHPRNVWYTKMNSTFYQSRIQAGPKSVATVLNFFQMLTIPNVYMPLDMFDVTADLYNLFIVIYAVNGNEVFEVTTKGSYNARHIFILFDASIQHYQPMVPNDFYASEFQLPRITYESTKGYPLTSVKDEKKHALDHRWRNNNRAGNADRREGPLPPGILFYQKTTEAVLTGKQLQ